MSDAWWRGELGALDARESLDALRAVLVTGLEAGGDPAALLDAVAERDPLACAELVFGSRAVRSGEVVRAALGAVELLEGVIPPATLYPRLADAAPDVIADVTRVAVTRHEGAPWLLALATRDRPAGRSWLRASEGSEQVCEACLAAGRQGREGFIDALHLALEEDGALHALAALARTAGHSEERLERLVASAAVALDRDPQLPIVPWLAAARGPDPVPVARRIHARVERPEARRALELSGISSATEAPSQ